MLPHLWSTIHYGGPWMIPVLAAGAAGIGMAAASGFTRRRLAPWAVMALALGVVIGMVAASVRMSFALDYIAAGPGNQKVWSPVTIAIIGLLPPYVATLLAAVGCGLLGVSQAYRHRRRRWRALIALLDGSIGCLLLVCFAIIIHAALAMWMGAIGTDDHAVGMAHGLASSVGSVLWPATLTLPLIILRGALTGGAGATQSLFF